MTLYTVPLKHRCSGVAYDDSIVFIFLRGRLGKKLRKTMRGDQQQYK